MSAVVLGWALRTSLGATVDAVIARVLAGSRSDDRRAVGAAAPSRHGRFLARLPLLALEAAHEAVAQAGVTGITGITDITGMPGMPGGDRIGVFAGVGGLRIEWSELRPALERQREDGEHAWTSGLDRIHPFWMLKNLSNNGHALLAADLGARGEGSTFGGATAGAQALTAASRALAANVIDVAVVVAYDTLLAPQVIGDPGERGAPYGDAAEDARPGEAAAAVVLARAGHGLVRVTAASVADGQPDEPRDATIARVVARVCPANRGAGTVAVDGAARGLRGDAGERVAIAAAVGPEAPLVAIASATGALGAATAIVQTIVLGELLRRGVLPPIAGLARAAAGPLRPLVREEAFAGRVALGVSTGAPGLAAAVCVEAMP